MLVGQVVAFGEIGLDVIQLPLLRVEHLFGHEVPLRLLHDGFPAISPDGARADHLVVLHPLGRGYRWIIEGMRKAGAFERALRDATEHARRFNAQRVE